MAKKFEELQFSDPYIFRKVLEGDRVLVTRILDIVCGEKLPSLVQLTDAPDRMICAEDESEKEYVLEMQNAGADALRQCLAFHNRIAAYSFFQDVTRTVIVICQEDYLNYGRAETTFVWHTDSVPESDFGDRTPIVVLIASMYSDVRISADLQAFLKFVSTGEATDLITETLARKVALIKEDPRYKEEYEASQRAN